MVGSAAKTLNAPPDKQAWLEHLKAVALFADLKDQPEALAALATSMRLVPFAKGKTIIKEGEVGSQMYLLLRGTAGVFKSTPSGDEYKVFVLDARMHPFFGEGSLIDSESRSATIRADEDCECLEFEKAAFEKFSTEHPSWALPVYKRIAGAVMGRLRKTSTDLLLLYNALVAEIRGH